MLSISLRSGSASQPAVEMMDGFLKDAARKEELARRQMEAAQREREASALEVIRAVKEKEGVEARLQAMEEKLHKEETTRAAMEQSLSWKVTAPIRSMMNALRSGRPRNQ